MARPCPFVACRYHLFLNVTNFGGIQFPRGPDPAALANMPETCALDVAAAGPSMQIDCAALFGITRERVRQIEERALAKLAATLKSRGIEWQLGDSAAGGADVGKPDNVLAGTAAAGQEEEQWLDEICRYVQMGSP